MAVFSVVRDDVLAESARQVLPAFCRRASRFSRSWSGIAGGTFRPDGWCADIRIPANAFTVYTTNDVFYAPHLGLIAKDDACVSRHSRAQAKYADAKMEKLEAVWGTRHTAPFFPQASAVLPWGAIHNYGHFLLDGLSSVPHLHPPFLTPPLKDWQREHFMTLGVVAKEVDEPLCRVGRLAYTSGFGGNFRNPNLHFQLLRDLQRSQPDKSGLRLYLNRKDYKRPFQSEDALVEALRPLGFLSVQPERLAVSEQIRLLSEAAIVVAPTGAALANCLECAGAASAASRPMPAGHHGELLTVW